jgi:UDP-N-acetylglucosamine 2-epimerase (non-hydrolysing)
MSRRDWSSPIRRNKQETTALGVLCLTLRENTERPVTVEHGSNQVVGVDSDRILAAAQSILQKPVRCFQRPPLWDGKAAPRIVAILRDHLEGDALNSDEKLH